jgi:hypothetical protein
MELGRYDKVLWRINGALIACGGLVALVLMLFAGYQILKEGLQERAVHDVVNVNEETRGSEYLSLKQFSRIQGTDWLVADLNADQGYQQAYYSKSASSTRNYLFFDIRNRTAHWMLDHHTSLILNDYELDADTSIEGDKRKVIGFLYEAVTKDTNGDNRLDANDKKSLIFYKLSASNGTHLLDQIDELLSFNQISPDEALVFFRDNQKNFVASLDIALGKLGERKELALAPSHNS